MALLHLRLVVNRAVVISLIVSTKWHWLLFALETKPPESHMHPLYTGTSCIIYAHNQPLFNIFYILIQLVFPPWFPSLNLHSDSFLIGSGKLHTLCFWGLSPFPRLLKKWEEGLLSSVCTRDCWDPCWSVTPLSPSLLVFKRELPVRSWETEDGHDKLKANQCVV